MQNLWFDCILVEEVGPSLLKYWNMTSNFLFGGERAWQWPFCCNKFTLGTFDQSPTAFQTRYTPNGLRNWLENLPSINTKILASKSVICILNKISGTTRLKQFNQMICIAALQSLCILSRMMFLANNSCSQLYYTILG